VKAIILAAGATLATLVMMTVLFRLKAIERRAYALLWVFLAGLALLVVLGLATPVDLGFLPATLLAKPAWFDLLSAIFFYGAGCFGGVLQLYNLADRGFSLRILIDLLESAGERGSATALFAGYGQGKGLGWMYEKRIDGMLSNDLVMREAQALVLTPSGRRIAVVYASLRRFLNAPAD
jgi:hypothetical protein